MKDQKGKCQQQHKGKWWEEGGSKCSCVNIMCVSFPSDTWAPVVFNTFLSSLVFNVLVSFLLIHLFCPWSQISAGESYVMIRQMSQTKKYTLLYL